MLVGDKIRRVFQWAGYNDLKKITFITVFMNILNVFLITSASIFIHVNWNNESLIMYLLLAAKDINVLLTVYIYSLVCMFLKSKIKTVLNVIDKKHIIYKNKIILEEQYHIIKENEKYQNNLIDKTGYLCISWAFMFISLPLFISAYIIIVDKGLNDVKVYDLPLPIVFWYPKNYEAIEIYFIVYIVETLSVINVLAHMYTIFGLLVVSFQKIITSTKLFCHSINNIDKVIRIDNYQNSETKNKREETCKYLKDYLRYLISCHLKIFRDVKTVNESLSFGITLANQCICFQMVVYLCCAERIDNTFGKVAYIFILLFTSLILYVYCLNGQKLINENDEIRMCLAQISWLNKPQWFRKSLLIMMTRADSPLEIKPYGLYVLNLNNYKNIMNAAYSYFNVIRVQK